MLKKKITAVLCTRSREGSTILILSFLNFFNDAVYAANKGFILIYDEYNSGYKSLNEEGYLGAGSDAHWSIFAFFQLVLVQELNMKIFSYVINPLRR